jgi:hypothetical protein
VLNGANQSPVGVKPIPTQPNQYRDQKSSEENLSAASAPEKKPHSRSNNHQAGIDYRYPGNCLLAHDGTMIITDLNKNDAEPPY